MTDKDKLDCHFCKRSLSVIKKGTSRIITCKSCRSEQWFNPDGSLYSWSFKVGPYELYYSFGNKNFSIRMIGGTGAIVVDIVLPEEPSYMTPESMTEERVKCIVVFS